MTSPLRPRVCTILLATLPTAVEQLLTNKLHFRLTFSATLWVGRSVVCVGLATLDHPIHLHTSRLGVFTIPDMALYTAQVHCQWRSNWWVANTGTTFCCGAKNWLQVCTASVRMLTSGQRVCCWRLMCNDLSHMRPVRVFKR